MARPRKGPRKGWQPEKPSGYDNTSRTAVVTGSLSLTRSAEPSPPAEKMKAAVLAAILLGQPVATIAARYGLSYSTVSNWKKAFDVESPEQRVERLSEDLMVFIQQEIQNLIAIAVVTSEEEWIKEQTASELADYIGVKNNTLLKVLEAFGKAQEGAKIHTIRQIEKEVDGMREVGMSEDEILQTFEQIDETEKST